MVDDYSTQIIGGVKTFTSTVSASAFYDTTTGDPLAGSALTAIASDGARRVIVSDGDGTATCYSNLIYNGVTLTASFSGSAAALTNIPLEPYKVSGQLSASNIYFGSGLQDSSNKIAVQGGNSITVGASGVAVDLATTGGLSHIVGKLKVSPNDATTKASTSNSDLFIIADSDAGNATKKITATVLGTYMQNTLTFTAPGGSDAQLQYKNGSAFAGSSNLTFNTNTLTTVNVSASGHVSSSLFVGNGSGLTNIISTHPPSGVDMNIQFNSGSTFSGSNKLNFNYDASTAVLQITGDLSASNDLAIGRDSLFGRDTTVMRNIITYGNVSASSNISASNFYGNGQTLANVPINNYAANRIVFGGASTNTLDAFDGLTWANPTLSVPGKVSSLQVSASSGVTGSSLHTLNTVINSAHISSSLNISGSSFYGNGSKLTGITATASPAGASHQIQFNNAGSLGASARATVVVGPTSAALIVTGSSTTVGSVEAISGSTQVFGVDSSDAGLGGVRGRMVQHIRTGFTLDDAGAALAGRYVSIGGNAVAVSATPSNVNCMITPFSGRLISIMYHMPSLAGKQDPSRGQPQWQLRVGDVNALKGQTFANAFSTVGQITASSWPGSKIVGGVNIQTKVGSLHGNNVTGSFSFGTGSVVALFFKSADTGLLANNYPGAASFTTVWEFDQLNPYVTGSGN